MLTKSICYALFFVCFLSSITSIAQIELLPHGDLIIQSSNNAPDIFFRNSVGAELSAICISSDKKFNILTGNSSKMTIDVNGNMGVGTSTPQQKLHVIGNRMRISSPSNAGKFIDFRTDGGALDIASTGGQLFLVGNNGAGVILQQNPGNVGIGNDITPDYKLEVDGTAGKPGGGSWSSASDRRLKKDIRDFEDGLQQILKIHPVWYRYNGMYGLPTEETYVGVIAQEIQEFAPYTVTPYLEEDDKGSKKEYLSYDGSAVTYMLVNAIKEQQDMLEVKAEQIARLEQSNQNLELRLRKIEAVLFNNKETNTDKKLNKEILINNAILYQNQPNPFIEITTVRYFIPATINEAALQISDPSGKILKVIPIVARGEGQSELKAQTLRAGSYLYSLVLDGQILETKQMILTK